MTDRLCLKCGEKFDSRYGSAYCSPACYQKARRDYRRRQCDVCGNEFESRRGARYCSRACRQKGYRKRTQPTPPAPEEEAAADSSLVAVYRILTEAGEPLTVPQIAEQMPTTGYLSWAMNRYREHKEQTDPAWLKGKGSRWGAKAQNEAMLWWVRRLVKSGLATGNITCMSGLFGDGEPTYGPSDPPKVWRRVWVEESTLVDWTPEDDDRLNSGQRADMQFIHEYEEFTARTKSRLSDAKALLELANRAIRAQHPR